MEIYEKNLEGLKKFRPDLHKKILKFQPSGKYIVMKSNHPKNYPNLLQRELNILAYNNSDPLNNVLSELKRKIRVPVLNILFGFGLGYEAIGFLQNYANQESVLVIIDPEIEPFYLAMQNIDFLPLISDGRVRLFVGAKDSEIFLNLYNVLMEKNYKLFVKAINIIDNPLSLRLNNDFYKKCMGHLKDAVREVLLHFGNDPWDSLIGIENTYLNINEIITNPGIKELKDIFKGKPGIVVATGPSLNKNINLLKGVENKAVLCAADASVRVMKKHNLKPHLVTSLERLLPTSKLFEGLTKEDVKDVFLSACPVIHPKTYESFPGERIIVYRNFATFQWIEIEKGILNIGPSAGNMAFKILEYLGCNPIILIGQDLAFGENEVTHASGATFGEKEEVYHTKRQILEVEGNYVPKIKTTDVWYKFLKFYEKDVHEFKGEVINATEGGAKIPGTKVMYFKDVVDKYLKDELDVIQTIRKFLKHPNADEISQNQLKMIKKTDDALEYSRYVLDILQSGAELTDRFKKEIIEVYEKEKKIDDQKATRLFETLQKPLAMFAEKNFYEIFMHFVQSYYMTTMVELNAILASDMPAFRRNFSVVMLLDDMYHVMIRLILAMERSLKSMRGKLDE